MLDEKFNMINKLKPTRIQITSSAPSKEEAAKSTSTVYDIIYLQKRDLYAFW